MRRKDLGGGGGCGICRGGGGFFFRVLLPSTEIYLILIFVERFFIFFQLIYKFPDWWGKKMKNSK